MLLYWKLFLYCLSLWVCDVNVSVNCIEKRFFFQQKCVRKKFLIYYISEHFCGCIYNGSGSHHNCIPRALFRKLNTFSFTSVLTFWLTWVRPTVMISNFCILFPFVFLYMNLKKIPGLENELNNILFSSFCIPCGDIFCSRKCKQMRCYAMGWKYDCGHCI